MVHVDPNALEQVMATAREAGRILRDAFNQANGAASPELHVQAMHQAERLIVERVGALFPEDGILGKELGALRACPQGSQRRWLVSPCDTPQVCDEGVRGAAISIARQEHGAPVLGVVHAFNDPDDEGDLIAWAEGGPVLRNGGPVPPRTWPGQATSDGVVLLARHAAHNAAAYAHAVQPMRFRTVTSMAHRLALAAVGEGEAAVSLEDCAAWDLAAGHAILVGAGADLYDAVGQPVRYPPQGALGPIARAFGGSQEMVRHLLNLNWPAQTQSEPPADGEYPPCRPRPGRGAIETDMLARAQGCLLGQLAGDALGSLVEFGWPYEIKQKYPAGVRELADGGTWNTLAGQPTDDSEMALILARAILSEQGYDDNAAARAYAYWYESFPFDMGGTICVAIGPLGVEHKNAPNPAQLARAQANTDSQANGAMMRICPVGIFGAHAPLPQVAEWARLDASLTHPHPVCTQANALFAMALAQAIRTGPCAQALYGDVLDWARRMDVPQPLAQAIHNAASAPPEDFISSQGWVLIAFQNALYQLLHAPSLEQGVVDTVMRGGDTDTNAAICGALLGAVHGRRAIAPQWTQRLHSCRPLAGLAGVARPRPQCFWPVDALELAEALLESGRLATQKTH